MAKNPVAPDPQSKSRIAGDGATRIWSSPYIPGASQTAVFQGPVAGHPKISDCQVGISITPQPSGGANGTTPQPEFSPGILYVRGRLLQMRDRSQFELEPYPSETLIASAWDEANRIVMPGVPTPSVVPSEDGNVSLVWHKGGWDVEIEIAPRETEVWADNESSSESLAGTFREAGTRVLDLLHKLGPSQ